MENQQELRVMSFEINPLHLACGNDDMRPNTKLIEIKNGIASATNGSILVKIDLSVVGMFSADQLKVLEGKFIHSEVWKEMSKCDSLYIDEQNITCNKKGINKIFEFSEPQGEFFKIDTVIVDIKHAGEESKRIISFSPLLIGILQKIFKNEQMVFSFSKGNLGTIVFPEADCGMFAVLMPRELSNLNRYFFL